MGFRFRKSINLGGGLRINLSKSGIGYSYGTKGLRYTKTAKGGKRITASIPQTGISYVVESSSKSDSQQKITNDSNFPIDKVSTKRTAKTPLIIKILAVICGTVAMVYYVQNCDVVTAVLSGVLFSGIAYLILCAIYGVFIGGTELKTRKKQF